MSLLQLLVALVWVALFAVIVLYAALAIFDWWRAGHYRGPKGGRR